MRIDLNLKPVVGGKVRVMCKSYRQATKKESQVGKSISRFLLPNWTRYDGIFHLAN